MTNIEKRQQISRIIPMPIKEIKSQAMRLWEEAPEYENAGLLAKADDLRREAIEIVCKAHDIHTRYVCIQAWEKASGHCIWQENMERYFVFAKASKYMSKVPKPILKQMTKITDKERLLIMTIKRNPDPILLYVLPLLPLGKRSYLCIELAKWK